MNHSVRLGTLYSLIFSMTLMAFLPTVAIAAQFKTGEQPAFASDESIQDDLYMAGGNVTTAGSVFGDMLLVGGTVLSSGSIAGDVAVAGGTITIAGNVGGDVRVVGGTVVIQSLIHEDAVIAGGHVTLSGEGVGGDVTIAGGTVLITAPVSGSVKIFGGEVTINAPVAGNVTARADSVALGENAVIRGSFSYRSPEEAVIAPGAEVAGETLYEHASANGHTKGEIQPAFVAALAAFATVAFLMKFLATFIAALFIAYFFRRYSHELVRRATEKPWSEIVRGLVFFIVLPIISLMLLMTIIGLPLGILGFVLFGVVIIFVSILVPVVLGSVAHKKIWNPPEYVVDWKTILLGIALYFLLGIIPIVGWIINLGFFLLTLGTLLAIKWEIIKTWR